jgi:hypothetical protein
MTTASVRLQVDVGFGDAITPEAEAIEFPALLEFPAPRLRAYPRETVVAEKLEAMVKLGLANTRMKDFYDLALMSKMFAFDGETLVSAIRATFERRGTPLPSALPTALTPAFTEDPGKSIQWSAFLRKSGIGTGEDLPSVTATIAEFLAAPLTAANASRRFALRWSERGPWR